MHILLCKIYTRRKGEWIGVNATILPGVIIGDGCIIVAGSVVTKECEKWALCRCSCEICKNIEIIGENGGLGVTKIEFLKALPKSIIYNLKIFPIKTALKCPLLISYNTKIAEIYKNSIIIAEGVSVKFGMIKIGFAGTEGILEGNTKSYIQINKKAKVIFDGDAFFAKGSTIRVNDSVVSIGNNFWANRGLLLSSHSGVKIGANFLSGWGCSIQDSSNHTISHQNMQKNETKEIIIGEHVWFGAEVACLKGSVISDDSVVAMRSVVTKSFTETNILLGGTPAKIIQHNINWEK